MAAVSFMKKIKAVIGSASQAMQAAKVLERHVIRCTVIKIGTRSSRHGCIYGIEFSPDQLDNVRRVFDRYGIAIKELLNY